MLRFTCEVWASIQSDHMGPTGTVGRMKRNCPPTGGCQAYLGPHCSVNPVSDSQLHLRSSADDRSLITTELQTASEILSSLWCLCVINEVTCHITMFLCIDCSLGQRYCPGLIVGHNSGYGQVTVKSDAYHFVVMSNLFSGKKPGITMITIITEAHYVQAYKCSSYEFI